MEHQDNLLADILIELRLNRFQDPLENDQKVDEAFSEMV